MNKKVNVLLSSYNGEKYITEQLESILNQTYPDINIYVRDDGSSDKTVDILRQYEKEGKIHLEIGQNLGFIKSFQWLIANGGEADYYAFADQDDVWFENKIQMAVDMLRKTDPKIPVLYFSNYDFYDGEMNFISHRKGKKPNISFVNSLVDCVSLGFNSVFNHQAKVMVANDMPQKSTGHDWWMYMVCAGMGKVIYDERATVKYRRHGNNVSGEGHNFIKFQIWRFKKFFINNYFRHIREQLKEYASIYGNRLKQEDKKALDCFTKDGFHPGNVLHKVFYPAKLRQGLLDELFIRFIFLIGKL